MNNIFSNGVNAHLQKTIAAIKGKKTLKYKDSQEAKIKVNESVGQAAFYYEKLRNAIEYQDEHLFLKNAIKRILKRRTYLGAQGNGLALLKELVWAKYFENETIPISLAEEIDSILRKYTYFRENAKLNLSKTASTDLFVSFAACEIEELLSNSDERDEYMTFCKQIYSQNINLSEELPEDLVDIQIEISIRKVIVKEDWEQLRYKLLSRYYKSWPKVPKNEGQEFIVNFPSYFEQVEKQIIYNKKSPINKYIKKTSPAFNIIYESIHRGTSNFEHNLNSKDGFNALVRSEITRRNDNIRKKVLRGVVRGIFFILLTKLFLAFVIEIPYELKFFGELNYPALITNIALPPVLMMIIGLLIKVPGNKNTQELVRISENIIFENKLVLKKLLTLKKVKSKKFLFFDFIYLLMSLSVLGGVIWLLIHFKFNMASIALFYIFVSLVSFLGFRIRSTAKEMEVRPEEDSVISGLYNFILLPFVVIGKFLSDRWSEYNITLFFWDFIIEAPFKAIIGLFEAWLSFSREKREEFE